MSCLIEAHDRSYWIDDPGGIIGNCLTSGKPYELKALEHMYRSGSKGTAIDVGAGVGNHSLWLAAICGLEVLAFEPLDWWRLEYNTYYLNNDLPIICHPYALGKEETEGEVHPAPSHVTGRALNMQDTVPIYTLDSHVLDDVSLIKIDVEGMEPDVLLGANDTIKYFHPLLYVEAVDKAASRRNADCIPRGYEHVNTFGATPLELWEWQG